MDLSASEFSGIEDISATLQSLDRSLAELERGRQAFADFKRRVLAAVDAIQNQSMTESRVLSASVGSADSPSSHLLHDDDGAIAAAGAALAGTQLRAAQAEHQGADAIAGDHRDNTALSDSGSTGASFLRELSELREQQYESLAPAAPALALRDLQGRGQPLVLGAGSGPNTATSPRQARTGDPHAPMRSSATAGQLSSPRAATGVGTSVAAAPVAGHGASVPTLAMPGLTVPRVGSQGVSVPRLAMTGHAVPSLGLPSASAPSLGSTTIIDGTPVGLNASAVSTARSGQSTAASALASATWPGIDANNATSGPSIMGYADAIGRLMRPEASFASRAHGDASGQLMRPELGGTVHERQTALGPTNHLPGSHIRPGAAGLNATVTTATITRDVNASYVTLGRGTGYNGHGQGYGGHGGHGFAGHVPGHATSFTAGPQDTTFALAPAHRPDGHRPDGHQGPDAAALRRALRKERELARLASDEALALRQQLAELQQAGRQESGLQQGPQARSAGLAQASAQQHPGQGFADDSLAGQPGRIYGPVHTAPGQQASVSADPTQRRWTQAITSAAHMQDDSLLAGHRGPAAAAATADVQPSATLRAPGHSVVVASPLGQPQSQPFTSPGPPADLPSMLLYLQSLEAEARAARADADRARQAVEAEARAARAEAQAARDLAASALQASRGPQTEARTAAQTPAVAAAPATQPAASSANVTAIPLLAVTQPEAPARAAGVQSPVGAGAGLSDVTLLAAQKATAEAQRDTMAAQRDCAILQGQLKEHRWGATVQTALVQHVVDWLCGAVELLAGRNIHAGHGRITSTAEDAHAGNRQAPMTDSNGRHPAAAGGRGHTSRHDRPHADHRHAKQPLEQTGHWGTEGGTGDATLTALYSSLGRLTSLLSTHAARQEGGLQSSAVEISKTREVLGQLVGLVRLVAAEEAQDGTAAVQDGDGSGQQSEAARTASPDFGGTAKGQPAERQIPPQPSPGLSHTATTTHGVSTGTGGRAGQGLSHTSTAGGKAHRTSASTGGRLGLQHSQVARAAGRGAIRAPLWAAAGTVAASGASSRPAA